MTLITVITNHHSFSKLYSFLISPQHKQSSKDDYISICHFPEHRDFVQACLNAEAEAKRCCEKQSFTWRGSRCTVGADLPPITIEEMEVRLMNALQKVDDRSIAETMVKKVKC